MGSDPVTQGTRSGWRGGGVAAFRELWMGDGEGGVSGAARCRKSTVHIGGAEIWKGFAAVSGRVCSPRNASARKRG